MSFIINQNFDLKSAQWNFERDYFKDLATLKAAPETNFPDHFITNVAGVLYQLTKSNSVDETTGKWRKLELGSDVDLSAYAKSADVANTYAKKSEAIVGATYHGSDNGQHGLTIVTGNNVTKTILLPNATPKSDGFMSTADKNKLDGLSNYTLSKATAEALGGIKTGYTTNDKNYKVDVDDNGNAYVNVPWSDTKTDISGCAKLNVDNKFTGVNEFTKGVSLSNNLGKILFTQSEDGESLTLGYSDGNGIGAAGIYTMNGTPTKVFATDGSFFDTTTLVNLKDAQTIAGAKTFSGSIIATNTITANAGIKDTANAASNKYFATDGTIQTIPTDEAITTEEIDAIFNS